MRRRPTAPLRPLRALAVRVVMSAAVWAICGGIAGAAALEEPTERLVLESGDQLSGRSLSVDAGYLRWQLGNGEELMVPLNWVVRVDTRCTQDVVPAQHSKLVEDDLPPAPTPPTAPQEGAKLLSEPDSDAVETPWTAQVPYYTTLHQGYVAVSDAYTAFNDLASTWTRRINVGGQFIDGNANADSLTVQVEFENGTPKMMRQIDITGQMARNNDRQTANKWTANSNFDWPLDLEDKWIMFFSNKNEYDAKANLDYRGTVSTGMGYRFYNDAKKRLITRFGPAYTVEIYRDPYDHRESPDLFGEFEMRWPLKLGASLEQKMRVQPSILDFELVRVFSTTGFLIDLDTKDRWKLRLGLNYTYNSQPNPGRVPSDYISSVTLMYTRK